MELRNGIAAFDPVTLRIAAEQLPTVQLPEAFDGDLPDHLVDLSEVEVGPFAVIARIDTGQLTWDRDASREVFTTYRGTEASGVRLSGAKVAQLDDVPVARVSVRLNGDKLRAWFAELPAETPLDSLEITERVRTWMRDFSRHDKRVDTLTVPQQNVNYEAFVKGLDRSARQKITAVIDEHGAHVTAETVIPMSLPSFGGRRDVTLGEKGPVLFWFSEGNENKALPSAIVYTQAEAWVVAEGSDLFQPPVTR